jgi:hypothetical protein
VREIIGQGEKTEIEVLFDEEGAKRLLLAWAPLEKVGVSPAVEGNAGEPG